jgi:hypothetical protein
MTEFTKWWKFKLVAAGEIDGLRAKQDQALLSILTSSLLLIVMLVNSEESVYTVWAQIRGKSPGFD